MSVLLFLNFMYLHLVYSDQDPKYIHKLFGWLNL